MWSNRYCLSRNRGYCRTLEYGGVVFHTSDRKVDFNGRWEYKAELLEFCNDMGIEHIVLRSDSYQNYYGDRFIKTNPPTTINRLTNAVRYAAKASLHRYGMPLVTQHRKLYEELSLTAQFLSFQNLPVSNEELTAWKNSIALQVRESFMWKGQKVDSKTWAYCQPFPFEKNDYSFLKSSTPELDDQSRNNGYKEAMKRFS